MSLKTQISRINTDELVKIGEIYGIEIMFLNSNFSGWFVFYLVQLKLF
jgi:hypothetical protein